MLMPIATSEIHLTSVADDVQDLDLNSGLMDSAWPMFHHDTRHTGLSPFAPSGNWRVEKWRFKCNWDMIYSSPAIDNNGTIYVGFSGEHCTVAINPDGTEKWRANMGSVQSSPAIGSNGIIYIGTDAGRLYAIFPNGTIQWWISVGQGWTYSSPAIDTNGIIYCASVIGSQLVAIYPNGTIKWVFKTNGWIYSSPAIADDGTIYVGSNDYNLYAIHNNGTLKWKYHACDCIQSPPSIDSSGNVYFGSWDDYLYCLDPNGTLRWKYNVGTTEVSPAFSLDGDIIATGNCDVFCFSSNGTKKWTFHTNGNTLYSSPLIDAHSDIYCASCDGNLYAFNKNGNLRWTFPAHGSIESSPVIAEDGTIYICGSFAGSGSTPDYSYLYALGSMNDTQPALPTITGDATGHVRHSYNYTIRSTDPDNDTLSYYIDWGDGTTTNWTTPTPSGQSIVQSHTWEKRGTYTIKVKARDEHGRESDWGTLTIKMPYEPPRFPIIHWLLDRFPNAFPLLRRLLDGPPRFTLRQTPLVQEKI